MIVVTKYPYLQRVKGSTDESLTKSTKCYKKIIKIGILPARNYCSSYFETNFEVLVKVFDKIE